MPVEVKELVIRAVVEEPADDKDKNRRASSDNADMIDACAEQVLKILERKRER